MIIRLTSHAGSRSPSRVVHPEAHLVETARRDVAEACGRREMHTWCITAFKACSEDYISEEKLAYVLKIRSLSKEEERKKKGRREGKGQRERKRIERRKERRAYMLSYNGLI